MNFGHLSIKKTLSDEEIEKQYGRTWIWTALDATSRLIICHHIGDRTLEECRVFFKELKERIDNKPMFTSDELPHYKTVILESYHIEQSFEKTGKPGRPKSPIKIIDPEIDYATVHKTRENSKITNVERKIVFGDANRIQKRLEASPSKKINTAYIERSNGTLRLYDSHLQRKTIKFAKEMSLFKAKLAIIVAYYNLVKPHYTLSKNEDKTFTPRTPAMVAKITKSPWKIENLLWTPIIHINN